MHTTNENYGITVSVFPDYNDIDNDPDAECNEETERLLQNNEAASSDDSYTGYRHITNTTIQCRINDSTLSGESRHTLNSGQYIIFSYRNHKSITMIQIFKYSLIIGAMYCKTCKYQYVGF